MDQKYDPNLMVAQDEVSPYISATHLMLVWDFGVK